MHSLHAALLGSILLISAAPAYAIPPELLQEAEAGDPDVQRTVGFMYGNGISVQQNLTEAAKWYRKAAEQGNAEAQYLLGFAYADGLGVEQSSAEAIKWFEKAAQQGHESARLQLQKLRAENP
ncbi:MAG: tetratricopeptide repeat protein [Pseudomonadota bacterium]